MTPARIAVVVAILVAAAAAFYFWYERPKPYLPPAPAAPAPAAPTGPRYPVPAAPPVLLPPLKDSDPAAREAIAGLVTEADLVRFFNLDDVIRRIVATIDNLPRESYATRLNPLKPMAGSFRVKGKDEALVIDTTNESRYARLVDLAGRVDAKRAVDAYMRLYPLFQQAYVELGYPQGHFNDRLVDVIDHLLEAPDLQGPVRLVQPKVFYEFADPELERRSAGQKALMRVGAENAARLKAKLRELRTELVARSR